MRAFALAAVLFLLALSVGWGGSVEASGLEVLKGSGYGSVLAVSCAAPGDCAAGGAGGGKQAFVVSETNGAWGKPIAVPGLKRLNTGGHAAVVAISCPAAGECVAGGYYSVDLFVYEPFVVSETNGVWGRAIEVRGTEPPPDVGGDDQVVSISCAAVGECAAGGSYSDASGDQAFVVSETGGVWGTAIVVPGTAALNTGGYATVKSISCAAAGECAAGGFYSQHDATEGELAFVASETNGVWGDAIEVPGMPPLSSGTSEVDAISCPAAGECAAGGVYPSGAFLVDEKNGSWGTAIGVPGMEKLTGPGLFADVASVSCSAAGECAAVGGFYNSTTYDSGGFLVSETSGTWGNAIKVPGTAKLPAYIASMDSVSCAAPGECAAGGVYHFSDFDGHVLVVSETNGKWEKAIEVPGSPAPATGWGAGISVSCAAAGECAAGGYVASGTHPAGAGRLRAFVADETNGSWRRAVELRNLPSSCDVPNVVGGQLWWARNQVKRADCAVGTITYAYSKTLKGLIIAQRPDPGEVLHLRTKIALTVSKGRRRKPHTS